MSYVSVAAGSRSVAWHKPQPLNHLQHDLCLVLRQVDGDLHVRGRVEGVVMFKSVSFACCFVGHSVSLKVRKKNIKQTVFFA